MGAFVQSVKIKDYKSIGRCFVELNPFTLLVGPNGSGKSNFLDALRFTSDALKTTLEHALRDRGGIQEVRRRSRGHPRHFGISLVLKLDNATPATFAFNVGALANGGFQVIREECQVGSNRYSIREGKLFSSTSPMRDQIEPDRLYLTYASTFPEFRPAYDALSRMGFYSLNPEALKALQDPDPGELLCRDGKNAAGVIRRLEESGPAAFKRIAEYLHAIVPGIDTVEVKPLGPKETIEFRQHVSGDDTPWRFLASSMSDGALRVLGILISVFQAGVNGRRRTPLIGIEEPEIALHPAAARKLMDALLEAAKGVQIIVTTHSPDLLDHPGIEPDGILAVDRRDGETVISSADEASRMSVRDRLYTAGELLRLGQMEPDKKRFEESTAQLELFTDEIS
jgi:predicted ATPase